MSGSLVRFQRFNPIRPVNWRWQIASRQATFRRKRCASCDTLIDQTERFLRSSRSGRSVRDFDEAVAVACQLARDDSPNRWLLDAYLLARCSIGEISRLVQIDPATIACYEQIFFNITDRLDARDYIMLAAIGHPTFANGAAWLLKSLGYYGGPFVLERAAPAVFEMFANFDGVATYKLAAQLRLLIELQSLATADCLAALERHIDLLATAKPADVSAGTDELARFAEQVASEPVAA